MRYVVAIGIRLFMVILSEILYYKYDITYTDIDYHVFSDGSKYMLNLESPFERETYRYTPLLAFLMIPNHLINYNFGKILLSFIDVLVGLCIEVVLNIQKFYLKKHTSEKEPIVFRDAWIDKIYKYLDNPYAYISLIYLYNPLIIIICTRGSADCIITLLVLLTLIFIELGFYPIAGVIYGFAIHFKIYPIIYAPALYLYLISKDAHISDLKFTHYIDEEKENENLSANSRVYNVASASYRKTKKYTIRIAHELKKIGKFLLNSVFNYKAIIFAILTIIVFFSFLAFFYVIYGNKFLYEYLIYHFVRKDHRHNYSMFYYLIYLTYNNHLSKLISFVTFLPQALLIFFSSIFLFQEINLCLLIQTMIFVTLNKVVTAQYFLWYISIIPLIAPFNKLFNYTENKLRVFSGIILLILWFFFEIIWNRYSHNLEYKGENLFLQLWIIDVLFFIVNCFAIALIIASHNKKN